ncbi:WD-repeat protein 22 [Loa loa]|uniref:WD-repeat protein 22 n=1 Tax=Loa loa TaxID=7209 RepID=A0A1I7VQS7_LOALO|nr:WD-repeat protein 22 [Loa loa]EFO16437.2 WD-repeat protein 22 [Loa loa]
MVGIVEKQHAVSGFFRRKQFGQNVHNSWEFPFLHLPNRNIYQKDVKGHYGCVNAIEASTDENFLASGGDDRRVLMWKLNDVQVMESPKPVAVMRQMHYSNIFSVGFSNKCERLYSAGNDSFLYAHDIATTSVLHRFRADEPIYNVAVNPKDDSVIMSASEDGKVRLYDLRGGEETLAVESSGTMYCAQFNPRQVHIISVCNGRDGLSLHDIRKLDSPCFQFDQLTRARVNLNISSVMYGQWSDDGEAIFATRSRTSPILYDLNGGGSVEFNDQNYLNSCTVKSCSFISRDLVMTGSDDWNIYIWKVPEDRETVGQTVDKAYRVLEGHRSIVNHARYSSLNRLLFSSGVEKIIKLWSAWDLNGFYLEPRRRSIIPSTDYSDPGNGDSVDEDINMLAFFDLLTTSGIDEEGPEDGFHDLLENDASNDRMILAARLMQNAQNHDDDEDGSGQDDDNGSGDAGLQHLEDRLILARLRRRAEGTVYVVSSPEMSEPELLPEEGSSENDSSQRITNADT